MSFFGKQYKCFVFIQVFYTIHERRAYTTFTLYSFPKSFFPRWLKVTKLDLWRKDSVDLQAISSIARISLNVFVPAAPQMARATPRSPSTMIWNNDTSLLLDNKNEYFFGTHVVWNLRYFQTNETIWPKRWYPIHQMVLNLVRCKTG